MPDVMDLIERAATDPAFLMQLRRDPLAAAQSAGYDVSYDQLRDLLAMPGASEGALADVLQARLSFSSKVCTPGDNPYGQCMTG